MSENRRRSVGSVTSFQRPSNSASEACTAAIQEVVVRPVADTVVAVETLDGLVIGLARALAERQEAFGISPSTTQPLSSTSPRSAASHRSGPGEP
jgi:hypothetical protein